MKRKLGLLFILAGCGLIAAACTLFINNQQEQQTAEAASRKAIIKVVDTIRERQEDMLSEENILQEPVMPMEKRMPVVEIDGYEYIGFLGISSLNLELPVMAGWSEQQLLMTPCRYSGDLYTEDLVIMAHNYRQHFGRLYSMRTGDPVTFTDMDGNTVEYEVAAMEVLTAEDVENMTAGEYALTLFTCDYSGNNRVAVRCDILKS